MEILEKTESLDENAQQQEILLFEEYVRNMIQSKLGPEFFKFKKTR